MKLSRHIRRIYRRLRYPLPPESVCFFTFHKCASTLFSTYVLRNLKALEHVDHAGQVFKGKADPNHPPKFRRNGYVYGPFRSSNPKLADRTGKTIDDTGNHEFFSDKIVVCLVRDPRDILVSHYFSIAFSHAISPVESIARRQLENRKIAKNQSIDEFVLENAQSLAARFEDMHKLLEACPRSQLLHYEEMIENFDTFAAKLSQHLPISSRVIEGIRKRTRPKQKEDPNSHQRSGKTGGHQSKLKPATITKLNEILEKALKLFSYTS